jgi:capsular exopolysaccharide synthesis family protein
MRQENSMEFKTVRQSNLGPDHDGDDEIDLRGLLGKLWRGKWIILVSTFFAGVIGFLVAAQFEPTYTARTKVMFDINRANVIDVGQSVVRLDETILNQVEVLQSTRLIERVIEERALTKNPYFNPKLRADNETLGSRIASFFSLPKGLKETLQNLGLLTPPAPPPDEAAAAEQLRLSVISQVRSSLSLEPVWDTKVIEISFETANARLSSAIANTFAQEYIVDELDAKLEATREATTWLSERVEELRLRVQDSEEAVEAIRAELAADAGQGLDITRAQLEALNASLSAARAELSRTGATFQRLSSAVEGNLDFGAISEFRASRLIQQYRETESDLLVQAATLETRVAEDHPARIRVAMQLEDTRDKIRLEVDRIVEAARLDLSAQQDRVTTTEVQLRELEVKALSQSQSSVRIRQLEREAEASRAVYENFLGRLKETSEQEALQTADARVLSPAEVPLLPDAERVRRTQLLSLVLGAFAGVGFVFLIDLLNNTFRAPAQLEELTGQSYLGAVPSVGRRLQRSDVIKQFKENPKSALAEAVRSLRTSILFSSVDNPPKTVMLTSSVPKEGKSTTSMLVAMTSRQMGKSAIIVDCDLRLPSLARLLPENDGDAGLLSVLEGSAKLEDAIFRDKATGLDVLMTRPSEPRSSINAADILASQKFKDILKELQSTYDLVVLDTPPTLVVADARILSAYVDAVVYVVAWDRTPRGAVLEGIKELKSVNAPLIGVTFTMLNEGRASKYSYDGYSYYRGKYRDYYVS